MQTLTFHRLLRIQLLSIVDCRWMHARAMIAVGPCANSLRAQLRSRPHVFGVIPIFMFAFWPVCMRSGSRRFSTTLLPSEIHSILCHHSLVLHVAPYFLPERTISPTISPDLGIMLPDPARVNVATLMWASTRHPVTSKLLLHLSPSVAPPPRSPSPRTETVEASHEPGRSGVTWPIWKLMTLIFQAHVHCMYMSMVVEVGWLPKFFDCTKATKSFDSDDTRNTQNTNCVLSYLTLAMGSVQSFGKPMALGRLWMCLISSQTIQVLLTTKSWT